MPPSSWASPDGRRVVTGTAFGSTYERVEQVSPPVRSDVLAGLLTVAVTVLAGAPVGLAWAVLAPRPQAVRSGDAYVRADASASAYIAADGFFLGAVLVAGIVTGVLAWKLARAHGPAVAVGLATGGLAAAFVAMQVGQQLNASEARSEVARRAASLELPLELGAREALAGWAVAALVAYGLVTALHPEQDPPVSSG